MAAVNFSLRCARQSDKGENERWIQSIEDDFTKRLDRNYEPSLEFSVILGEYLVNFMYLDNFIPEAIFVPFANYLQPQREERCISCYTYKKYPDRLFLEAVH